MSIEAMKLALDALIAASGHVNNHVFVKVMMARDALNDALRTAIEAVEKQEPVAYIHRQGNHWEVSERFLSDDEKARGWTEDPLYTAPPSAQRQPLTDEQIAEIYQRSAGYGGDDFQSFARAIERAVGIGGKT